MLCHRSFRRQTLQRRLARRRAGGVKSCANSKQIRSCKTLRQPTCLPDKSLTENDAPTIKLAVRYHGTQQYSVNALTDSSGTIKERYAYDAYGNLSIFDGSGTARTSTAEGNRYTYTGREYDDGLDLYHYRARMYDSIAGRFCSRDPIGYWDGPAIYRGVRALTGLDPVGLAEVIGVRPDGRPIYRREQGDPPGVRGLDCYYVSARGPSWIRCPNLPPNDLEGPDYLVGLQNIRSGLAMLESICDQCCSGNCSNTQCKNDAQRIVQSFMLGWQNNYFQCPEDDTDWPHTHPDCVAGQYCFTWAEIFMDAFNKAIGESSCFTGAMRHSVLEADIAEPKRRNGRRFWHVHWYLTIEVAGGGNDCSMSIDDGFAVPNTCIHKNVPHQPGYIPFRPGQGPGRGYDDHPFNPLNW
ncbi:tRNA3(Ser)-specific nuclease WapA precursor [Stieleria neptunia]|uniref:tRNA3(Ser)-specific nuclease WapA n=1 Tax=Stieleria neptunia TaxID=2527979 RepID=A0A518HXL4_9BACT|nr:tRNA3(Ser)-specific nuclease WapA precursor [Stieleria neptunia]